MKHLWAEFWCNPLVKLKAYSLLLLQIFMDMAVLVDAQGEMLDNIESQVSEYTLFNVKAL